MKKSEQGSASALCKSVMFPYIPNFNLLYSLFPNLYSGSVVERPLCDREVAGSIPGRVIPETLKMVLAALSLGLESRARTGQLSVSIM